METPNSLTPSQNRYGERSQRSSTGTLKTNFKTFVLHHQDKPEPPSINFHRTSEIKFDNPLKEKDSNMFRISAISRLNEPGNESHRGLFSKRSSLVEDKSPLHDDYIPKSARSSGRKFETRDRILENYREEDEFSKFKIKALNEENEALKYELMKVKEDFMEKQKLLKRSNDDLVLSYEERHRHQMQNLKDGYESEIMDLKLEVKRLENEFLKYEDSFQHQKEKLIGRIDELERENLELYSKVGQFQFAKNIDSKHDSTNHDRAASNQFVDQILKEKFSVKSQYDQLFNSYSILLEHNKKLTEQFNMIEQERDDLLQQSLGASTDSKLLNKSTKGSSKYRIENAFRKQPVATAESHRVKSERKATQKTPKGSKAIKLEDLGDESAEEKLKASILSIEEDALRPKLPYSKTTNDTKQSLSKVITSQSASKISRPHQLDDKKNFINTSNSKIKNRSISSIHAPEERTTAEFSTHETKVHHRQHHTPTAKNYSSSSKENKISRSNLSGGKPDSKSSAALQKSSKKNLKVPLYSKINKN